MRYLVLIAWLLAAGAQAASGASEQPERRLAYNQPGLVVDLNVGLWAVPLPMDFDGDGDNDMVVSTANAPSGGLYYFENDGSGVFAPARKIADRKASNIAVSFDGTTPLVCEPGKVYLDFRKNLYEKPQKIAYKQEFYAGRDNQWRFADYDGDGALDLLIGASDWREYGWDDAYDATGRWTAGPLHGYVYWVKNLGTTAKPRYGKAQQIMVEDQAPPEGGTPELAPPEGGTPELAPPEGGTPELAPPKGGTPELKPVDVFGAPSPNLADWDGDGDLDLICGEFLDRLTLFINEGTRTAPRYGSGQFIKIDGKILHYELEMPQVVVLDWDRDGDPDIIAGEEDGRVSLAENAGKGEGGLPRLKPPVYFKQRADLVKCGVLCTPFAFDWDGDGDQDLLSGDSAGFISLIENLDGKCPPKLAPPRRIEAGGEIFRAQAGPNLSIQGPAEAKWGYTAVSVADWDLDGLPDVLVNDIIGRVRWLRNVGTRAQPRLEAARAVEVEWAGAAPKPAWNWWEPKGKELVIEWRTRPNVLNVNKDGLPDLVAQDHEGFLAYYERARQDDKLILKPGKRIFEGEGDACVYDANNGKVSFDLNKDGKNDLVQAVAGALIYTYSIPGNRDVKMRTVRGPITPVEAIGGAGFAPLLRMNAGWAGKSGRRKFLLTDWDGDGKIDILANSINMSFLKNAGEGGRWVFRDMGPMVAERLAGHDTCPAVVDWNGDGKPELVIGAEDGYFYYYQ